MRCCSPLLENTDVRYCPATFATLTCCSSLIPRGKSCSIRLGLCEHLCERLMFQEHSTVLAAALSGRSTARSSPMCPLPRVSSTHGCGVPALWSDQLLDESFNITVAMVLAALYGLLCSPLVGDSEGESCESTDRSADGLPVLTHRARRAQLVLGYSTMQDPRSPVV